MRVTNSMLVSNFMNNLNNGTTKLGKLQTQLASNRKYGHISEDPVSVIYSQQARFKLHKLSQYQSNVEMAQSWMTQTETSLMELNELLQSAYEQAIDAATDVKGETDRDIISKYVGQLRDQVLSMLNSTMGDKYLFGGYNSTGVVGADGQLMTPFDYMTMVDLNAMNFSPMESAINSKLSSGALSLSYTPPGASITTSSSSSDVGFTYSLAADGTLSVTASDGVGGGSTQSVNIIGLAAGAEHEFDFGAMGKLKLGNTGAAAIGVAPAGFVNSVSFGDTSMDSAFSDLETGLTTELNRQQTDSFFTANTPTITVSVSRDSNAGLSFTSGSPESQIYLYVSPKLVDGKMQIEVSGDNNAGVQVFSALSDEMWTPNLTPGVTSNFTFHIEGFGDITLDYTNGATAPVINAGVSYSYGKVMDVPLTSTPADPIPSGKISAPAGSGERRLTYNGIDLMTTDPDERAILDHITSQITEFDIGPGVRMSISENGANTMLFSSGTQTMNIYNLLDKLTNALQNGASAEEITSFVKPLQDAQNFVLSTVADVGGRSSRLELVASRYEQDFLNYTQMKSDAEDADQAELIMNYKMAEAVYQAALATGAYIIQPTLMDFLR